MKLAFSTLGCPDWSLGQIASNAKNYGYDGIELRVHQDHNHISPDLPMVRLRTLGRQFADNGVAIMSLAGYTTFSAAGANVVAANQAQLTQLVKVAEALGAKYVRTFAGRLGLNAERQAVAARIAAALKAPVQAAADQGIVIGIETHDDWTAAQDIMLIVSAVGSPAVGVVYDVLNVIAATGEPWAQSYAALKERLCYCHVKDGWCLPDGRNEYVPLGAGDLPWREIFARLKADGYAGYLTFEWEKKWLPELAPPEWAFPHFRHKARQLWDQA